MENHTKLFKHPIHSMLSILPVGLFISTIIFDTIFLLARNPILSSFSFAILSFGTICGVLAAILGVFDLFSIPSDTRAKQIATRHAAGNLLVVSLFGLSWWLRSGSSHFEPSILALIFSYSAAWMVFLTVLWGDELLYYMDGSRRAANVSNSRPFSRGRASDFIKTLPLFLLPDRFQKKRELNSK